MKEKQIQSYVDQADYNKLKQVASKQGLSVAALVRMLILNHINNERK